MQATHTILLNELLQLHVLANYPGTYLASLIFALVDYRRSAG
jgi:hypothetical protein